MATLVLTAVGTALGGPLGGALGSLAGRALDAKIMGSPSYEGARLKELAVTTSSYGSHLPRHFGKVRSAGTIIWATDLAEHKEQSGGGKGKPKATSYTYSISCAVALSTRPIRRIGRIWADGNLLRGASGDLKVGGVVRVYTGSDDQMPDALIASDIGGSCPAFRGISYVVFEDLQLADFGNRIPALTFEIIADDSELSLSNVIDNEMVDTADLDLSALSGLTHDSGSEADLVSLLSGFYPLSCRAVGGILQLTDSTPGPTKRVIDLPAPTTGSDGDFASRTGLRSERLPASQSAGIALRYYDPDRDYQPGLQRSRGSPGLGNVDTMEFPATIAADAARELADKVALNRECRRERMSYRMAVLDPEITCGSLVRPAGERGIWQVLGWEWRTEGVELELEALSPVQTQGLVASGDAGRIAEQTDVVAGSTALTAFELPWDGTGNGSQRQVMAAVSSDTSGWSGASLYLDSGDGAMEHAGFARKPRAIIGTALTALMPSTPHLLDRLNDVMVELVDSAFALDNADLDGLARGANLARLGDELIQFGKAEPLGHGRWRLSNLLRGRGGTEALVGSHANGEPFVLIDNALTALAPSEALANGPMYVSAIGNGDPEPVVAPVAAQGLFLRPLSPIRPKFISKADGSRLLTWVRRARGGWQWLDEVDVPLGENVEAYQVKFVSGSGKTTIWETSSPSLLIDPARWGDMTAAARPRSLEIRQVGLVSLSPPLLLSL